jgi:hypothetical protein
MKINVNYRKSIVSLALAGFLFVTSGAYANTIRIFTLSADEWARPRSGDVIPELAAVRAAVSYWDRSADAVMLIRHPGEDSGELWAAELRDWLISLGVPSDLYPVNPRNPGGRRDKARGWQS